MYYTHFLSFDSLADNKLYKISKVYIDLVHTCKFGVQLFLKMSLCDCIIQHIIVQ